MMSLIDLFAQIAVKIHCEDHDDEEYGTGTLISDGERCYVLTAGHCVKKKSNGYPFDSDSIELTSYAASAPFRIKILSPVTKYDFSENKDYAVLEVETPNISLSLSENVKRCDTQLDEETYYFYGYSQPNEQGRLYTVRRTGKNQWHLCDDAITNQDLGAYQLMAGNSGAGVFFVKTGILYHIGYVKRLIDEAGAYSDVIIYPTCHFDGLIPEITKETNLFELVKKWTALNQKGIDDALMNEYQANNQEYLSNLSRKMRVLYPKEKEATEKEKIYLGHYLRGLELNAEINKSLHVAKTLKEREDTAFKKFCDDRSKYVEDKEARDDMDCIQKQITEITDDVLGLHDRDKAVAQGYAEYSIAEKLLDCSLDYRKENDD